MGLWSKMVSGCMGDGWMDGYPLDCYDYQSTCGANNHNDPDANGGI